MYLEYLGIQPGFLTSGVHHKLYTCISINDIYTMYSKSSPKFNKNYSKSVGQETYSYICEGKNITQCVHFCVDLHRININ